jgi:diguanylate cyclase (GGDEF)-like protein
LPHHVTQMATQPPDEAAGYERRIRIASELATWGTSFVLVASAALPTTDETARLGLLFSAFLFAAFALLWFRLLPARIFGPRRFTIGTAITQLISAALLVLTGGADSNYFVFFFLPTLATTFAMRLFATVVTGTIAIASYFVVLAADIAVTPERALLESGAVRLSALFAVVAMSALITKTMQDTRAALRQRTTDLASQNVELDISRSATLAIARAHDLPEIARAVLEVARPALRIDRVFLFTGGELMDEGYTVGVEGPPTTVEGDPLVVDSPRRRAVRSRRTVVVNDAAAERGLEDKRSKYGVAAALFIPLIHRGDLIGIVALSASQEREWTVAELRVGEVIAESASPSLAATLALDEVREQRERLAARTKVLEGMNQLVEALSLATDEASTAEVAARSVAHGFRLFATTTLVTDASIALLEPIGIAGAASPHPVVNGPTNCPAIRSGRIFRVTNATDPVICPFMPFKEGSMGYTCAPLLAGGESLGALFMEPAADSVLEDTFTIAAADRVALAIANRRVLETAQRQATTDGLTGLHNRHFLREQMRLLHGLATRHGQSYAVIAFDVDGLKQVNDTYGHETGDLALRGFANVLRKTSRGSDIGVRSGGDEFLILIPHGGLDDARVLAERVRDALAAQGRIEPHTAITVSAGVSAWRAGRTAEDTVEAADTMLYAAKRAGKDRIMTEVAEAAAET